MNKNSNIEKIDFAIGGQAVIEGVMMRSPNFYVVSVRNEEGQIKELKTEFRSLTARQRVLKLPIIRGMVQLVESVIIGYKALDFSNKMFLGIKEEKKERSAARRILGLVGTILYIGFIFGFTIFLFKFLPLVAARFAETQFVAVQDNYLLFNAIDGVTKIGIFLLYLILISMLNDIRRVFMYHGAEHMSVWTYEKGLPLTVESARAQSRFHPRCGTSFILMVLLLAVAVYTVIPPADGFWLMLGERVLALPLIAGISYELLKISAKYQKNPIVKLIISPGLMLQRMTTRVPDDGMLEVALNSLKQALVAEEARVL